MIDGAVSAILVATIISIVLVHFLSKNEEGKFREMLKKIRVAEDKIDSHSDNSSLSDLVDKSNLRKKSDKSDGDT